MLKFLSWILCSVGFVFLTVGSCNAAGTLTLEAFVVTDDLSTKPTPATEFVITPNGSDKAVPVTTDILGKASISLPAGEYILSTPKPVVYLGKSFAWTKQFTVRDEAVTSLQLTSNNAAIQDIAPSRQIDDAGSLYRKLKGGVVTVESDIGSGSGFIIAPNIILTNSHVVSGSVSLRVRFERGKKVRAVLLCEDERQDIAAITADTTIFKGSTVLTVAQEQSGQPVAVEGERVIAIGSPLHQDKILTSGIISKVEDNAIISDVNVNHGNSGGPLFNMAGDVIGITTFGDLPSSGGPGISGIIPITKAKALVDEAKWKFLSVPVPSGEFLPDVPERSYPIEALQSAAGKDLKPYILNAPHNFQTIIITPPVEESLESAQLRVLAKGKQSRENKRGENGIKGDLPLDQKALWN